MKKNKVRVRRFDEHLIGKNRENKREATFDKLMVETLLEFMKDMNSQFK